MAFTIYLTNFCRYSLRDVFVQVADGCREVVQMFIGYTGAFKHELVQLIEAFLQKMYVCGYDNVNQLIIQVLSALYLQMASLVKNNDPQCQKVFHFAIQSNFFSRLFKQKSSVFINSSFNPLLQV